MDLQGKKVLYVNLNKHTSETKTLPDLNQYIGGVGVGLKLLESAKQYDPIIFSIGPLNGFFPYASKTAIVINSEAVEDLYIGGTLSTRIRFSGLDAIVLLGKSETTTVLDINNEQVTFRDDFANYGLPGKRGVMKTTTNNLVLDDYFIAPGTLLIDKMRDKNIEGLVMTGTRTFDIKQKEKYEHLYYQILERKDELSIKQGLFPSCSGCPMGCEKSKYGDLGGNILTHSLVTCKFAERIYSNINTAFSCLNVLGYHYTHEDLENLPNLIQKMLRGFYD